MSSSSARYAAQPAGDQPALPAVARDGVVPERSPRSARPRRDRPSAAARRWRSARALIHGMLNDDGPSWSSDRLAPQSSPPPARRSPAAGGSSSSSRRSRRGPSSVRSRSRRPPPRSPPRTVPGPRGSARAGPPLAGGTRRSDGSSPPVAAASSESSSARSYDACPVQDVRRACGSARRARGAAPRPAIRSERLVAELDRPARDRRRSPRIAVRLGEPGERDRFQLRRTARRHELEGTLRASESVSSACSVHRVARPRAINASISSTPLSSGSSSASSSSPRWVVLELREGESSAQPDPTAILVGRREVERAREQVVRLLDREGVPRPLGRAEQVRPAPRPPRRPRASGARAATRGRRDPPSRSSRYRAIGRVELPSRAARERPVGDVSDQHVLERELDVALDLALRATEDQPARLERLERLVHVSRSPIPSRTPRQKSCPITDASSSAARASGGRASMRAAIAARTVDGSSSLETVVRHGGAELLEEQRVPLGHRHDPLDRRCVRRRQQRGRHRLRVASAERLERERRLSDASRRPTSAGSRGTPVWPAP